MWRWIFINCPNVFVFVAPMSLLPQCVAFVAPICCLCCPNAFVFVASCTLLLQVHMHNCTCVFSRIARLLYISSSVKWEQGWKCQHDTEFCDRTKNGKKQNEEWWRSSLAGNCDTMVMERIIFHTAYNWIADNAQNYEDIGENVMNGDTHNIIQWQWCDNVTHMIMMWECDSHGEEGFPSPYVDDQEAEWVTRYLHWSKWKWWWFWRD